MKKTSNSPSFSYRIAPVSLITSGRLRVSNKLLGSTWSFIFYNIPSLRLTWHLKMDGWKTTFLWDSLFSGSMSVSGRVTFTSSGDSKLHLVFTQDSQLRKRKAREGSRNSIETKTIFKYFVLRDTAGGRNPAPVEVGFLSHFVQVVYMPGG